MPSSTQYSRIFFLSIIIIILIVLYGQGMHFPSEMYYDEIYHAKRVKQLDSLHEYKYGVSTHPHIWHFISLFFVKIFGFSSGIWRLPSLVAGILNIFLLYKLTFQVSKDKTMAYLASFLFAFDCMSVTQARIGMLNSLMLMFMLLSMICLLKYYCDQQWSRTKAFISSGIFFGLAFATREVAAYLLILYGMIIGAKLLDGKEQLQGVIYTSLLSFFVIPVIIFFGSYLLIPLFGFGELSDIGNHIAFGYRSLTIKKGHVYGSFWWGWPILKRPIWYFYNHTDGFVRGILCIGNPVIFWIIPLAFAYVIWDFFRKDAWLNGFILIGFFSQWLPWALVKRVQFFHFFYVVMPFVCMGIALILARIWKSNKFGKGFVIVYCLLVLAMFVYWYPLLTAMPITHDFYRQHMWFKSWV